MNSLRGVGCDCGKDIAKGHKNVYIPRPRECATIQAPGGVDTARFPAGPHSPYNRTLSSFTENGEGGH